MAKLLDHLLKQRTDAQHPFRWHGPVTLLLIGIVVLVASGFSIWSVYAAVQLEYFIVIPSQKDVALQWATAAEYNLSGFEVQCKKEGELDNAYHTIADLPARGSPRRGATYFWPVTQLTPGVTYCFRLREISTAGEPGETFDRCGYGLGIAPTPAATLPVTGTVALRATEVALRTTATAVLAANIATAVANTTATVEAIRAAAVITGAPTPITSTLFPSPTLTAVALFTPTLTPTFVPMPAGTIIPGAAFEEAAPTSLTLTAEAILTMATPTPTAIGQGSPLETPIIDPFATPTLNPFATPTTDPFAPPTLDPLATPSLTVTPQSALAGTDEVGVSAAAAEEVPETPTSTGQNSWIETPTPTVMGGAANAANVGAENNSSVVAAESQPTATATDFIPDPAGGTQPEGETAVENPPPIVVDGSPTPPYIVQTVTPTPITTPIPLTLTPLPTATPTAAGFALAGMMPPTAQNLTLMVLCLTFFTASGLGIIGLITSALYMRSRRSEDHLTRRQWW